MHHHTTRVHKNTTIFQLSYYGLFCLHVFLLGTYIGLYQHQLPCVLHTLSQPAACHSRLGELKNTSCTKALVLVSSLLIHHHDFLNLKVMVLAPDHSGPHPQDHLATRWCEPGGLPEIQQHTQHTKTQLHVGSSILGDVRALACILDSDGTNPPEAQWKGTYTACPLPHTPASLSCPRSPWLPPCRTLTCTHKKRSGWWI